MFTTLNKIQALHLQPDVFQQLLGAQGKSRADDAELNLQSVVDSVGLGVALECLKVSEGDGLRLARFGLDCARGVKHLMVDERSLAALAMLDKFLAGKASEYDLEEAKVRSWAAVNAAVCKATLLRAGVDWAPELHEVEDQARNADWAAYWAIDSVTPIVAHSSVLGVFHATLFATKLNPQLRQELHHQQLAQFRALCECEVLV